MRILVSVVMGVLAVGAAVTVGCVDSSAKSCSGDRCVCSSEGSCDHECSAGAPECNVSAASTSADVTCDHNGQCVVQCGSTQSCEVDCGGSTQCTVACPASNCTVKGCEGETCTVSCGGAGAATRSGTTATCP